MEFSTKAISWLAHCALIGCLNLTKIEHIANIRKLHYYVDLENREEDKLEVKMQKLQQNRNMSYEKEVKELLKEYNIEICLTGENTKKIKAHIEDKILKQNDKEIKEEISNGKKTQMMHLYNKEYIEKLHFEEARAIFMMITRMIDVKANYKNKHKSLECNTCRTEDNTLHLFKCTRYQDLNRKIKGETIQEILRKNHENEIAVVVKEIIKRQESERKEKETKSKASSTAPPPLGLSLPDGRV